VLDLADNGELFNLIRRERRLPIDLVKFYAAEIVTILEYLRSKGVAHRDLKPSNLLLDVNYHLKMIDFGTAKIVDGKEGGKDICLEISEKEAKISAMADV
jgi:3-phosphoinositide dependent protein kinase-1